MRSLTTTATLTPTDKFVLYDTSAGAFNITLCAANAVPVNFNVFFYGYNASGTNVVTVVAAGADLIRFGGASGTSTTTASKAFTNAANARTLWSDGVQFWYFQ